MVSAIIVLASVGLSSAALASHGANSGEIAWTGNVSPGVASGWMAIAIIIFFSAIASSMVGFAFSAIAGAMILHFIPDGVAAVQVMMVASIGIQAYSVAELAGNIRWARCAPFIGGGLATLPLGIGLLLCLHPRVYVLVAGTMLIACGICLLIGSPIAARTGTRPASDLLVGALGGITGPLAALPGFCVVTWSAMRGWDKVEQRAVYQPYILTMQVVSVVVLFLLQPVRALHPVLLVYALAGVAGAVIGLKVFRTISDRHFRQLINFTLIASGALLILK